MSIICSQTLKVTKNIELGERHHNPRKIFLVLIALGLGNKESPCTYLASWNNSKAAYAE